MSKIRIIFIGKKSEISAEEKELLTKIRYRSAAEICPVSPAEMSDSTTRKKHEAKILLQKIPSSAPIILLDESGKNMDSQEFSDLLWQKYSAEKIIYFIIGGAFGVDGIIKEKAWNIISFGAMTWTKSLARKMLLEQIYRAGEIYTGTPFHKT